MKTHDHRSEEWTAIVLMAAAMAIIGVTLTAQGFPPLPEPRPAVTRAGWGQP